jgi:hypothetical protein
MRSTEPRMTTVRPPTRRRQPRRLDAFTSRPVALRPRIAAGLPLVPQLNRRLSGVQHVSLRRHRHACCVSRSRHPCLPSPASAQETKTRDMLASANTNTKPTRCALRSRRDAEVDDRGLGPRTAARSRRATNQRRRAWRVDHLAHGGRPGCRYGPRGCRGRLKQRVRLRSLSLV